jgi:NTE family protein
MKKVTVVLTGAGIYGYSGIALMEFFYEHQIQPNRIIGCSEGAFIAAMWAKGFSAEETLKKSIESHKVNLKNKINLPVLFSLLKHPYKKYSKSNALLSPKEIHNFYHTLFKDQDIEDLPIETIFQTTDVDTASSHYIQKGSLADAIYASSAILPFYPPIKIDNKWLINGTFTEFLPLEFLLRTQSDVIIIIDPDIPITPVDHSLMIYYAQFIKKALKKSSSPRSMLMHELQHSEIIIIPVKPDNMRADTLDRQLEAVLRASRQAISNKEVIIFDSLAI